ncbi:aspartate/glutamate racemase family protein [Nocardioides sp.]|uniref:aspartate/glutamate racemase family protein n=1 Tax=Nocardioides sp. TaxID=35761 RepID=UPI002BD1F056|nr:aspartate/glutamate racemase family protein [Nocardioides sp.]HXH80110.1 aspartate/glutamate racemase family protein [Nocardioides sp.]
MKTIGLIGGLSWYSTAQYYRTINELVQERRGGHASALIALQSLDFSVVRAHQESGDWAAAGRLLADAGRRCQDAGADVVLICANLMHRVADDVESALDVPLLRITDAIADQARARGWSQLGLLGTRWVMEEDFYTGRLERSGLRTHVPAPDDRAEVNRIIFDELTQGRVVEESRITYLAAIDRLADAGAEAVVLACTEIELLVNDGDAPIPLLDSMRVHAEAAVDFALATRPGQPTPAFDG